MAKTKQQKEQDLQKVTDSLKGAKSAIISAFDKVTVSDDQTLRRELRAESVSYVIVKKTLLKRAMQDSKLTEVDLSSAAGNLALAIGEDEVAPAKLLSKFTKDSEGYQLIGGWLEGELMDATKIKALSSLPGKQELIAKTVGTIKAPISGFVNVLGGTLRNLVYALNAVKDSKS